MNIENTNKKVLVVEDDEPTLQALRSVLEKKGVTVVEARNGVDGTRVALEEHPDLILLDILMPMMDGWEMLKKLRETNDFGKNVSVVVLTNLNADDEQIRHVAELGPSYFMVKADWLLENVVDKVLEVLRTQKSPL